MIENIRYVGLENKTSSFENFGVVSEGGTIGLEATPSQAVVNNTEDKSMTLFSIPVDAKIWGEDRESGDKVFICEASLEVDFVYDNPDENENIEETILSLTASHEWYFRNYMALAVKTSLESMLKNTAFDGIEVPLK